MEFVKQSTVEIIDTDSEKDLKKLQERERERGTEICNEPILANENAKKKIINTMYL